MDPIWCGLALMGTKNGNSETKNRDRFRPNYPPKPWKNLPFKSSSYSATGLVSLSG